MKEKINQILDILRSEPSTRRWATEAALCVIGRIRQSALEQAMVNDNPSVADRISKGLGIKRKWFRPKVSGPPVKLNGEPWTVAVAYGRVRHLIRTNYEAMGTPIPERMPVTLEELVRSRDLVRDYKKVAVQHSKSQRA